MVSIFTTSRIAGYDSIKYFHVIDLSWSRASLFWQAQVVSYRHFKVTFRIKTRMPLLDYNKVQKIVKIMTNVFQIHN